MKKKIFCFIPARLKSTRLPNKMILKIKKKILINYMYDICYKSNLINETYVATCDKIIENISKKNNAKVILTNSKHKDCISRVVEAVKKLKNRIKSTDYVLIVQGDEACVTSNILNKFCKIILKNKKNNFNLISKIYSKNDILSSSIVKCALNNNDEIIFMTRYPIPFNKNNFSNKIETFRQSGVIAFSKKALLNYSKLKKNYFEKNESIDMLRVLENNKNIQGYKVKKRMIGVDTLKDFKEIKKILN